LRVSIILSKGMTMRVSTALWKDAEKEAYEDGDDNEDHKDVRKTLFPPLFDPLSRL